MLRTPLEPLYGRFHSAVCGLCDLTADTETDLLLLQEGFESGDDNVDFSDVTEVDVEFLLGVLQQLLNL